MWISRRKSNREIDNFNNSIRRSPSNLNFIRSSLKDVENLFTDDDDNNSIAFNKTLDHPSPPSATTTTTATTNTTATTTTTATGRRLSIFHRVHLANKFARAFATAETPKSHKSPPDSTAETPKSYKSPPNSTTATTTTTSPEKPKNSGSEITIPGAEKRVILYTTSLRVVRPTFEACRTVRSILRSFRVSIDERDLSMDSRFLHELHNIMTEYGGDEIEATKLNLPRVFIGGKYVGGAEEVKQLHESGELKAVVERLPAVVSGDCEVCGDFRFVLCDECSGSHKCYNEKGGFRSCTLCNENGLVRCSSCLGR